METWTVVEGNYPTYLYPKTWGSLGETYNTKNTMVPGTSAVREDITERAANEKFDKNINFNNYLKLYSEISEVSV